MKQITYAEARKFALSENMRLEIMLQFKLQAWMLDNAASVVSVELKKSPKTMYGEWPKGWAATMFSSCKKAAKDQVTQEWIARNCKVIDGAIYQY